MHEEHIYTNTLIYIHIHIYTVIYVCMYVQCSQQPNKKIQDILQKFFLKIQNFLQDFFRNTGL